MKNIKIDQDIELRLLELSDSEQLFSLVDKNRKYLREWLPWLDYSNNVDDSKKFIQGAIDKFNGNKAIEAGIWYQEKLAGVIGLHEIDWDKDETAIGYWLSEDYQGKGLITRACKVVLDYCFNDLALKKVEIRCAVENHKSRAIPVKLGLKQERIKENAEILYDKIVDHVIYSITAQEYLNYVSE
jgi:ribosomal-protein-serine acetyltransferase